MSVFGIKLCDTGVDWIEIITELEITMSKAAHLVTFATAMVLTVAASIPVVAETPAAETTIGGDTCCFANPRFSGVCQVTTGPDETCSDVLAYLNNQASVGKTYCGNTKVRGGWAQVACEGSASVCTPPKSAETFPAE